MHRCISWNVTNHHSAPYAIIHDTDQPSTQPRTRPARILRACSLPTGISTRSPFTQPFYAFSTCGGIRSGCQQSRLLHQNRACAGHSSRLNRSPSRASLHAWAPAHNVCPRQAGDKDSTKRGDMPLHSRPGLSLHSRPGLSLHSRSGHALPCTSTKPPTH